MGFVLDKEGNYLPVLGESASGGGSGTSNHAQLSNLDYANSGHTGFLDSGVTNITTSGKKTVTSWSAVQYSSGIVVGLPWNPTKDTTETYTCPDDGFFGIGAYKSTPGNSFYLTVNGINQVQMISFSGGVGFGSVIPVAKNDVIKIYTDEEEPNWTVNQQRFYPLKGEV